MSARPRGRAPGVAAVAGLALVLLAGCAQDRSDDGIARTATPVHPTVSAAPTSPAAVAQAPDLAVGALFPGGTDRPHVCTATVVDSAEGDVAMTAAHCISGDGTGMVFVPGYDRGREPVGSFAVTGAHAPAGWLDDRVQDDDVAFLTLAPGPGGVSAESVTGAVRLDPHGAADGLAVTLTAYDDGIDDSPVRCTTTVRDTAHQPTIDCHGFTAGSSGTAWVASVGGKPVAVGLIGGLHQGGCREYTSYSPSLGDDVTVALAAAASGTASDQLPDPPDDGC